MMQVEFAAVEIKSGKVYIFGEGAGYPRRVYLMYDGLHYDPLYSSTSPARCIFSPSGTIPLHIHHSAFMTSLADVDALAGAEAAAAEVSVGSVCG
jgi:hypothetical protein